MSSIVGCIQISIEVENSIQIITPILVDETRLESEGPRRLVGGAMCRRLGRRHDVSGLSSNRGTMFPAATPYVFDFNFEPSN